MGENRKWHTRFTSAVKLSPTQQIGFSAEKNACQYLQTQGLNLICKNFRCSHGEIDLIMQAGEVVVFVEVRFRQYADHGHGIETLSASKKQRLIKTALFYLQKNDLFDKVLCRFDVLGTDKNQEMVWIKNAFEVEY